MPRWIRNGDPLHPPTAVRIHPDSHSDSTGVPLTTHHQATGKNHRVKNAEPTTSPAPFEQLRLW